MLFELFPRHIGCVVVVQVMVDAGDMLHIVEHLGYVVAHDDDGAFLVDLTSISYICFWNRRSM